MTPGLHADKIVVDLASGCWLWQAATDKDGYAVARWKHPTGKWTCRKAHRILYEHHVGPIPEAHELDHTCLTRSCVNPAHVTPVTATVNRQRIYARWLGEIKMEPAALLALHADVQRGVPYSQLAEQYGCSKGELIGVVRSTPYRRLSEARETEQPSLLDDPRDLPAYLR